MIILRDYQDRPVRLTEERRAHIFEHLELVGMEAELAETLRNPRFVIQSRSDPAAEMSYRYFIGTKVGDKWLCVVAKYSTGDAFVLTAYLTDKPKKGEQLWPKE